MMHRYIRDTLAWLDKWTWHVNHDYTAAPVLGRLAVAVPHLVRVAVAAATLVPVLVVHGIWHLVTGRPAADLGPLPLLLEQGVNPYSPPPSPPVVKLPARPTSIIADPEGGGRPGAMHLLTATPSRVVVLDEPDPNAGGACHVYAIDGADGATLAVLRFQHGPRLAPTSAPGVYDLDLLAICQHRLACLQRGPFASPYGANALGAVEAAIASLTDRRNLH